MSNKKSNKNNYNNNNNNLNKELTNSNEFIEKSKYDELKMQLQKEELKEQEKLDSKIDKIENIEKEELKNKKEKEKKERSWVINAGNIAILASSLSLAIDVIHKLLRMVLVAYSGLIIFLYVLAGILSVLALVSSIKYGFKSKELSIDAYLTGVSFVALILI